MSLTATRANLTHRCTIQRDGQTDTTSSGGTAPSWSTVASDVPCRSWAVTDRGVSYEEAGQMETYVLRSVGVIVPLGTDVTEKDRISALTYRGATLYAGPLNIKVVTRHADHLELETAELA